MSVCHLYLFGIYQRNLAHPYLRNLTQLLLPLFLALLKDWGYLLQPENRDFPLAKMR